jgi:transposase
MTPPPLPPELFDSLPPAVQAYIRYLESCVVTVASLQARVAELEARLKQNSTNSSKPPSSDGPHVKPAPPRTRSGKKRGGQPGHPKQERVLLPPDEVVHHKPQRCPCCDARLCGTDATPLVQQVIDLPVKLRHVIHHLRHTLECQNCHRFTTAAPVPEATRGFGPQLQAAVAYFSGVGRLAKRTTQRLLADLCDIPISLGSISKLEAKTSAALAQVHAEVLQETQGGHANVDETGWRQGTKKAWLWVAVTQWLTVFLIRLNRNRLAFDDLAGSAPGVLTTDRFPVYTHLQSDRRQVCWAHLRRDFQAMIDRQNAGSATGEELLTLADILFDHWQKVRDGTRTRAWLVRKHLTWLQREVRFHLEQGMVCGCVKTAGVCRELLAVEGSLWTFASVPGVEPTNNAAERALRHAVCWRKTSLGTDSERGSRFVERLLTVVACCRSQSRSVMEFLTQSIRGNRPSLLVQGA